MITQEQIDNLKAGDKLIFFRRGQVLSTDKGNVYTFANWNKDYEKLYWQAQEVLDSGNNKHSFCIYDTELFDKSTHKDFVIMNKEKVAADQRMFIAKTRRACENLSSHWKFI